MFIIVGRSEPLYALESPFFLSDEGRSDSHLDQFIIHSALDMVDTAVMTNANLYLKAVDSFGEKIVSAYVLPSGVRFMLLHERGKSEEGIRQFFVETHDLYVKMSLSPFYAYDSPITSAAFDARVREVAQKFLH